MGRKHSFTVNRRPKAKGRPRATKTGHVYTPKTTREYENAVKDAFLASGGEKFHGNVSVNINVYSHHVEVEIEEIDGEPSKLRGDLDNYVKSILDGLNKHAYLDDKQVHEIRAWKKY